MFNMVSIALDIGGANTKICAFEREVIFYESRYFPMWRCKDNFSGFLSELKGDVFKKIEEKLNQKLCGKFPVGVTMTAELCDAFETKNEGVIFILKSVREVFSQAEIFVLLNDGSLCDVDFAVKNPYRAASANYMASAHFVSGICREYNHKFAVLIDIGSTTTDIIPIINYKITAAGMSDFERLGDHKLLYTGALRTSLSAIVNSVEINGKFYNISSEMFSITADVYHLLGDIGEDDYKCETPDGRGKTVGECSARIARILCSDINEIESEDIKSIAKFIKEKQLEMISKEIKEALKSMGKGDDFSGVVFFTTGSGSFLARQALRNMGADERMIIRLDISACCALSVMVYDFGKIK